MSSTIERSAGASSSLFSLPQSGKETSSLGKEEFLTLLTTQLCNQNPLNPMQDVDFSSQLAQITQLEETVAMTKTMTAMRVDSQLQSGTGMIGRYVSGVNTNGETATGMVMRVSQDSSGVYVELDNGQKIDVASVNNIWNDADSMYSDIIASGNVIGMWVQAGVDANGDPVQGIVEKIQIVDGQVALRLYGGKTVNWSQITEMRAPTDDEVWYTLPDEVRADVEKAQKLVNKGVSGTDADGKAVDGIVAGAELDGTTVYLILYSGERIAMSDVGSTRAPTADDAASSLRDYWVSGLTGDGGDIGGIVVGAGSDASGMYIVLDSGDQVYFDTINEIRAPGEGEADRLTGLLATGVDTTGAKVSGVIVGKVEVDGKVAVELDNGKVVYCENIASLSEAA